MKPANDSDNVDPEEHVVLKVFPSDAAAEVAAGQLRANGIECFIETDDAGGMIPSLQNAEGVKLLVPANRLTDAKELLES